MGGGGNNNFFKIFLSFVSGMIFFRCITTPSSSSDMAKLYYDQKQQKKKKNNNNDNKHDNDNSVTSSVSEMARSLDSTPIGSLGPASTTREHFIYYDNMYFLSMQYGRHANNALEVGCSSDPFVQYLTWINEKSCVAPYFVNYEGKKKKKTNNKKNDVELITADFMKWDNPNNKDNKMYDLLICSQVVEHVDNPGAFMKKLIGMAKTSIISVPYDWPDCGKACNHKTHHITLDTILQWTAPYVPFHHSIIHEDGGGSREKKGHTAVKQIKQLPRNDDADGPGKIALVGQDQTGHPARKIQGRKDIGIEPVGDELEHHGCR